MDAQDYFKWAKEQNLNMKEYKDARADAKKKESSSGKSKKSSSRKSSSGSSGYTGNTGGSGSNTTGTTTSGRPGADRSGELTISLKTPNAKTTGKKGTGRTNKKIKTNKETIWWGGKAR